MQVNLDKKLPKSRARLASVNSDMSTTSDATSNLACRPPSTTVSDLSNALPRSHSGSDVSMTSLSSRRLLKAKSKVILDSDEETDTTDPSDGRLKHLGKMRADTLSDDDNDEPITDPAIMAQIDALVASNLSGLSNQHPYLEAITSENENPHLLTLGLYLALLKADTLQKHIRKRPPSSGCL